jgi:hypothetical protein
MDDDTMQGGDDSGDGSDGADDSTDWGAFGDDSDSDDQDTGEAGLVGDDTGTQDGQGDYSLSGDAGQDGQAQPDWADEEAQHHDDFQPDYTRQYMNQFDPVKVEESPHSVVWRSPDGTRTITSQFGGQWTEYPDGRGGA